MIANYLAKGKKFVETELATLLASEIPEYSRLYESMNYSLLQGGKRIRPILTMAVLESLGEDYKKYTEFLCALELIHTYSLIHDDLPAMDNDDYRRGHLTNHKVFGEGMAILAGDGLLTYAFELCTKNKVVSAQICKECIEVLAAAAGPNGMVGGQAFDLLSESKHIPLEELKILHRGKTGALFSAAVELGLILGQADASTKEEYRIYANCLGLLFQITDDILDVVGTVEELGKTPGSDERQDKSTYVSLLGLEKARAEAIDVANMASQALDNTTHDTRILEALVTYLVGRSN